MKTIKRELGDQFTWRTSYLDTSLFSTLFSITEKVIEEDLYLKLIDQLEPVCDRLDSVNPLRIIKEAIRNLDK